MTGSDITLEHQGQWTIARFCRDNSDEVPRIGDAQLRLPRSGRAQVVLNCDPVNPSRIRSLRVLDPELAAVTVDTVLGPGAAHSLAAQADFGPLPAIGGPPKPSPRAGALCRLALANWYTRWTPLNIPVAELLTDLGVAAHQAGEVGTASDAFDRGVDHLLDLARACTHRTPQALREAIHTAITAARASLGPRHHLDEQLGDAQRRLRLTPPPTGPTPELFRSTAPLASPDNYALAAGRRRSATWWQAVDWDLVPPRVVDPDETAVTCTINNTTFRVDVRAHRQLDPDSATTPPLLVNLVDQQGTARCSATLTHDRGAGMFRAEIDVRAITDVTHLTPDIRAAGNLSPTATGATADEKRDRRWATRALCSARLALAHRELDHHEAAHTWWQTAREQAINCDWTWLEDQEQPPPDGLATIYRPGLPVPNPTNPDPTNPGPANPARTLISELLAAHRDALGSAS